MAKNFASIFARVRNDPYYQLARAQWQARVEANKKFMRGKVWTKAQQRAMTKRG